MRMTDETGRECVCIPVEGMNLPAARAAFEAHYCAAALQRHDGNMAKAAEAAGVPYDTFRAKVRRLGIRRRFVAEVAQ